MSARLNPLAPYAWRTSPQLRAFTSAPAGRDSSSPERGRITARIQAVMVQHANPARQTPGPVRSSPCACSRKPARAGDALLALPGVTPFRQQRGRAAQPSGLRSANFYKPDGGWQANQGWLGRQRLAPLAPQIEDGAIGRKRNVFVFFFKATAGRDGDLSCKQSSKPSAESWSAASPAGPNVQPRRWQRAARGGRRTGGRACAHGWMSL